MRNSNRVTVDLDALADRAYTLEKAGSRYEMETSDFADGAVL